MIKMIGWLIWNIAEVYKIKLGRFAPLIFAMMVGRFPRKNKEKR